MIVRSGPDFVCGGRGNDRVKSGRDNDRFWGGRGADRLNGGPGNDTMLAGRDDGAVDAIDCGSGTADHAVMRTGDSVTCELVDTIP
jgi:Ca2+-binding RTX toxin-like protein